MRHNRNEYQTDWSRTRSDIARALHQPKPTFTVQDLLNKVIPPLAIGCLLAVAYLFTVIP